MSEEILTKFEQNLKSIQFYTDTETYLDLEETKKTINKINVLLSESSNLVIHILT
jgi:hypothetical protein